MSNDDAASRAAIPESARPLPAKPSLEFERKRAKKMLRELRAADPAAKLTDAQFAIAREYGFTSWPRLVEYFETLDRHERSEHWTEGYPPDIWDRQAQSLVNQHRRRYPRIDARYAMFVPRFYGRPVAEVANATVTIDDARLLLAREHRCPSWEILIERAARAPERRMQGWKYIGSPTHAVNQALADSDLTALISLVEHHPELLAERHPNDQFTGLLPHSALTIEWDRQTEQARAVTDWVATRAPDMQVTLNRLLVQTYGLGPTRPGVPPGTRERGLAFYEFLIARGADPDWVHPNGISTLEHIILRAWSGELVDFFAKRVKPRKALWISAGLGDVRGVLRYFNADGSLKRVAYEDRPDFHATTRHTLIQPSLEVSHGELMLETFSVALMNGRFEVMDALIARGVDVNSLAFGYPFFFMGISMRSVPIVEYFISRGANLELREAYSNQTARAAVESWLGHMADNADMRRIYELLGGTDADAVIERHKTRPVEPASIAPVVRETLDIAKDNAVRRGHTEVEPDDVFFAIMRHSNGLSAGFIQTCGVDMLAFKRSIEDHLVPVDMATPAPDVPISPKVQAMIEAAKTTVKARRRSTVSTLSFLEQYVADEGSTGARLIVAAGGSLAKLREQLARV